MNQDKPQGLLLVEEISYINEQIRQAGLRAKAIEVTLTPSQVKQKAPGDYTTKGDEEVAKMLIPALGRRFDSRTHGVVTEDIDRLPPECRDPNAARKPRIFVIDPIDGTDNYYEKHDGQYCVMIGLLVAGQPAFGWIYAPTRDIIYFGGPGYGVFYQRGQGKVEPLASAEGGSESGAVRIIMGSRDPYRKDVEQAFEKIEWVKMGSLGLKVVHIIEGHADLYLHLVKQLKVWDTAAPVALALAAGLKVCDLQGSPLRFDVGHPQHDQAIIIGRANWVNKATQRLMKSLQVPMKSTVQG